MFQEARAQSEKDTVVYYLTNSGKLVKSKDSADYFMVKMPADNSTGETLYPVLEYYANGKRKLSGASKTRSSDLLLQGSCIRFFPNGRRKSVMTYKDGYPVDDVLEYYPNGKLYSDQKYSPDIETVYINQKLTINRKLFLMECRDSTGKILAENGNGKWLQFDEGFTKIIGEGSVKDSLKSGEWHGVTTDSVKYVYLYDKGALKSGVNYDKSGKAIPFVEIEPMPSHVETVHPVETEPTYKGGIEVFYQFLSRNIVYPDFEKKNHITGKVYVSFVVEKDGTLTDVKVARGASPGLDSEAVRVIKLSKPWIPGAQDGKPVRVQYTVPVNFALY